MSVGAALHASANAVEPLYVPPFLRWSDRNEAGVGATRKRRAFLRAAERQADQRRSWWFRNWIWKAEAAYGYRRNREARPCG